MDRSQYATLYRNELLKNVVPFWEKYSLDQDFGGYFTCLDRVGNVFDKHKFVWLQARQAYMFAKLFLEVEQKKEWLQMAQHGATFLLANGRDEKGHWFFSLQQNGLPQVQAYNIFSDCFAALAFGTLYKIDPDPLYKEVCIQTFNNILQRQENPKLQYEKTHPSALPLKNFGLPMIVCNLCLELQHILDKNLVTTLRDQVVSEVMNTFYDAERSLVRENVGIEGQPVDSFEGRLINPGHAIEAMWFVMDQALIKGDRTLMTTALNRAIEMIEYGWDEKYGGIFYFLDAEGHPPQQLEWDQKLWWVHLEALIAMSKGISLLNDHRAEEWFLKIHNYAWNRFRDSKYGEWYGYLNRRGEVLLSLKGGKWKGCFHVPRALLIIAQEFER